MFKTDIIVEVRTTSNRLPGKAIKKIINRPVIELMIERLKRISNVQDIIIATTVNTDDDVIEKISNKNKVKWALSNVIEYKGKTNKILINWSKKYKNCKIKSNYISFNDNTIKSFKEVLIHNYEQ